MDELPDEILLKVLGYLAPLDLFSCAVVCRRFDAIAVDNQLWQAHYRRSLSLSNPSTPSLSGPPSVLRRRALASSSNSRGGEKDREKGADRDHDVSLSARYRADLKRHVTKETKRLWKDDVLAHVDVTRWWSILLTTGLVFFILWLLIWGLIHRGTHATSSDFLKDFHQNWDGFCEEWQAWDIPGGNVGDGWLALIVLLVMVLIHLPFITVCWCYPGLYWVLFTAEVILTWLGRTLFAWMLPRWPLQDHKTTSALLGGNSILLALLLLGILISSRALFSYYRNKRRLKHQILHTLRQEPHVD